MESTFNHWYTRNKHQNDSSDLSVIELLNTAKTVAIVGISRNQHRDSHYVGRYLKYAGYQVIPVNPGGTDILNEKTYPDLKSIPFPIDIIDIFRRPEDIPDVVDEAISVNPKAIWLQLGTGRHPEVKLKVESRGIQYIENRCVKVDHQFLIRPRKKN